MYDQSFKQRYIDKLQLFSYEIIKNDLGFNLNTDEKGFFPHHLIVCKMQIM